MLFSKHRTLRRLEYGIGRANDRASVRPPPTAGPTMTSNWRPSWTTDDSRSPHGDLTIPRAKFAGFNIRIDAIDNCLRNLQRPRSFVPTETLGIGSFQGLPSA